MSWNSDYNEVDYCVKGIDFYKNANVEELQSYKEEPMKETIKIDIPKGSEFAGIDDDNQQVVFEKIKLEYPKTYEECCKVLNRPLNVDNVEGYKWDLLSSFQFLLVCRDAYWKITGDWKPDFVKGVYGCTIRTKSNKVIKDCGFDSDNSILAFPTEEMRDIFYENFKDLIEECKELL